MVTARKCKCALIRICEDKQLGETLDFCKDRCACLPKDCH